VACLHSWLSCLQTGLQSNKNKKPKITLSEQILPKKASVQTALPQKLQLSCKQTAKF
jgi:hypothetical protein